MAIPAESFYLERDADGTLQQKIQRVVVDGILSGRFRPGERLPSSRKLADHLGVSRITVTLAYTDLLADDYLTSKGRSGYFVSESAPPARRMSRDTGSERGGLDWARRIGRRAGPPTAPIRPADWRSYPYPFIYGQADANLLDHQNWRLCALQALGARDFEALTSDYYERDDPSLVEYILRHILPRRGISARPENVLITMGAQNALWLAAQLLLTQRRTAALENPAYPGLREILDHTRCKVVAVDVDEGGLPPARLPRDLDAVFVTLSHHCPTSVTMPLDRRRALLKLAEDRGFVIIEDDYEFEISFKTSISPALKSMDRRGHVIYIGSFSKSLFPGLRLGYIVAPEPFVTEARSLRATVLRHPPGHIQRTAAYFLSLGHYDAQVNRMRKVYAQRRAVMEAAIRENGLTVAGSAEAGGSSLWMSAPRGVDTGELAQRLLRSGVVIEPGRAFFHGSQVPANYYRLAYSSITAAKIPRGVELIAEGIRAG